MKALPASLSLSKGRLAWSSLPEGKGQGFDKLSQAGVGKGMVAFLA